jgi:mannose-1-phosphate guanylyltransferase
LEAGEQGNIVAAGASAEFTESKNNIIVSEGDHLFGLIGVKDLVVVHSSDATLICHKSQAQSVKDLVARLEQQGKACL